MAMNTLQYDSSNIVMVLCQTLFHVLDVAIPQERLFGRMHIGELVVKDSIRYIIDHLSELILVQRSNASSLQTYHLFPHLGS